MNLVIFITKKSLEHKKTFNSFSLFFLLVGFILGNLFGINFYFIKWNIFSIFLVPILLELTNFVLFSLKKNTTNVYFSKKHLTKKVDNKKKINFSILQILKKGFLLGIFIEAFKVGS